MSFCSKCLNPISYKNGNTISLIRRQYLSDTRPWVIGFSGGKDSSALLKLVFSALLTIKNPTRPIYVVYCDTGVEIPTVSKMVKRTLKLLENESEENNLPIKVKLAKPEISDSYFVKVIGRGYPPPTNIFRWCTDRLRIKPVQQIIKTINIECTVLLGVRRGESNERDKILERHSTDEKYFFKQNGTSKKIFTPIVDYKTVDIWSTLQFLNSPNCIDAIKLGNLYKDAGNECPVFKETKGTPCGQGRFGCWTCTVVRKDKAVSSMVKEGYNELAPLLDFRNWLIEIRDKVEHRNLTRRNGVKGLGPFKLKTRKLILKRLRDAEKRSKIKLITAKEVKAIKSLWTVDKQSRTYIE